MTSYRDYNPTQGCLLPPDPREWLPGEHLAYYVDELVGSMDLEAFHARYRGGDGRRKQPYHPTMMVKVLVYAYVTGVYSSRRIAARLETDVAFMVLAAGNRPAHRTICEFRQQNLGAFRELLAELVMTAAGMGLVEFGKLSVDGTRMRANASRTKSRTHAWLGEEEERLRAEVGELLEKARGVDEAEDAEYGRDVRGDELPEALRDRKARARALSEAKARLAAERGRAAKDAGESGDAGGSWDARDAGGSGGGAEAEVSALRRLDAAVEAREKVEHDFKERKKSAVARGGHAPRKMQQGNTTDADSRIMRTMNEGYQQCYNGQLAVDGKHQIVVLAEVVNNASDHGVLPTVLEAVRKAHGRVPARVLADGGYCNEHDLADLERRGIEGCVNPGRDKAEKAAENPEGLPATLRMARRFETEECREAYRERKWLSEAPNAWIKRAMGFRQFSVRGMEAVRGEWNLVCLALNIRRMHGLSAAAAGGG